MVQGRIDTSPKRQRRDGPGAGASGLCLGDLSPTKLEWRSAGLGSAGEGLAEAAQMFAQHFRQSIRPPLIEMLEGDMQQLALVALIVQLRRHTQRFELTEIELALLADKATIESVAILRSPLSPPAIDARHTQGDRIAGIP